MKLGIKPLTEQQELVMRLHKEEGMTYRQIAEGLGLSRGRVQRICADARQRLEEYEENPRDSFVLLPKRVRNLLEYLELDSRSEVLEAVKSGRMYYDKKEPRIWVRVVDWKTAKINVADVRNAGWKSWEILLQWLGLPKPAEQEQLAKRKTE